MRSPFARRALRAGLWSLLGWFVSTPAAAVGSVYTYQGLLEDDGAAVSSYDFEVYLFGQASGGAALAGPFAFDDVALDQGRFLLQIDPGPAVFDGADRWMELRVRRGAETGGYTQLLPRQRVFATPYAQHAGDADFAAQVGPGSVGTLELADGAVTGTKVDSATVQRRVTGACAVGAAITAVMADGQVSCAAIPAPAAGAWALGGNAGTDPALHFLGTTDAAALELRVQNLRALRLQPAGGTLNVTAGYATNGGTPGLAGVTVAGGGEAANPNVAGGNFATVSGGRGNQAGGTLSVVAGGHSNRALAAHGSIGGGTGNSAAGAQGTIAGGAANLAAGIDSSVGGGYGNSARGVASVVPGGNGNCAGGNYSYAAGTFATVRPAADPGEGSCAGLAAYPGGNGDVGSFAWADAQGTKLITTGSNQFLVRAAGGVWFGTDSAPSFPAGRFINTSTGAHLTTGGSWTNNSDRRAKDGLAPVDPADVLAGVLALPIYGWHYRVEDERRRHLGPTAQDFHAAFGLNGDDDTAIATIDADGVALAAIQGMHAQFAARVKRLEGENTALRRELQALGERLAALEHAAPAR